MKQAVIVIGLLLLFVANVLMMYRNQEGFQTAANAGTANAGSTTTAAAANAGSTTTAAVMPGSTTTAIGVPILAVPPPQPAQMGPMTSSSTTTAAAVGGAPVKEAFQSYTLANAAGTKDSYEPIGAYDGVSLPTGNASAWRYTAPNEKLLGADFVPGPDSLFMFKNNQCKPECCGASFSCGGGCVCTTPEQRQYIASRGGNRTAPEDSA